MAWVLLVLAYGIIKGLREVLKKKALERNSVIEVLFLYTFLSFLLCLPELPEAGGVEPWLLACVALKSFAIFLAWMFGFMALTKMPVSLYGVIDLSRVVFATLLGVIVLDESMGLAQTIGLLLVLTGLILLKRDKHRVGDDGREVSGRYILMALASCLLNALSGLSDKLFMSHTAITDKQLQFWYMLFLVILYGIYIVVRRPEFHIGAALRNGWIWLLAILFVIADRCLFIANSYPESRVTVMTLIKQSGVLVTIVCGRLIFKEKHTGYRMLCALIVLAGICVSVLLG